MEGIPGNYIGAQVCQFSSAGRLARGLAECGSRLAQRAVSSLVQAIKKQPRTPIGELSCAICFMLKF